MWLPRIIGRSVINMGYRYMSTSKGYLRDHTKPNWFQVGLAFGTSAFLWALLFKQHSTDIREYKARNCVE
uniref:NADH dehydrogenase [ubiquinone] 1 subunit C1, mitochondrial n=1 Tax=Cynoglossus semilaevis TaxID=244447 RepID=A0A3P8UQG3_CYNSE